MSPDAFWERIAVGGPDECWLWQRSTNDRGYGHFAVKVRGTRQSRMFYAHRRAWEVANEQAIPAGKEILHSCDNPPCCNPAHLRVGTRLENMRDAVERGRVPSGERHYRSKLTDAQVLEIRCIRALAPKMPLAAIAFSFGVSRSTVCRALSGRRTTSSVKSVGAAGLGRDRVGERLREVVSMPEASGALPQADAGLV